MLASRVLIEALLPLFIFYAKSADSLVEGKSVPRSRHCDWDIASYFRLRASVANGVFRYRFSERGSIHNQRARWHGRNRSHFGSRPFAGPLPPLPSYFWHSSTSRSS